MTEPPLCLHTPPAVTPCSAFNAFAFTLAPALVCRFGMLEVSRHACWVQMRGGDVLQANVGAHHNAPEGLRGKVRRRGVGSTAAPV